jgi:hypothetical protein
VLVKRYEGKFAAKVGSRDYMFWKHTHLAMQHWVRDIKMLQNMQSVNIRASEGHPKSDAFLLSHPSLPQMVGFSQNDVPTPFLVLTNGSIHSPLAMWTEKYLLEG